MHQVKVSKYTLLSKVKTNRESHRSLFLKAQVGYREAVIKELDEMLSNARDNKPFKRALELPEPIDCTKDYDRVISMLEMSIDIEVSLHAQEFDQYVMDNWAWKEMAQFTNSSYLAK